MNVKFLQVGIVENERFDTAERSLCKDSHGQYPSGLEMLLTSMDVGSAFGKVQAVELLQERLSEFAKESRGEGEVPKGSLSIVVRERVIVRRNRVFNDLTKEFDGELREEGS